MTRLKLYGTSACHLCELAEQLIQQQLQRGPEVEVEVLDICDSDELFQRLGTRIPVLEHPDGRELSWPFTAEEVTALLYG